MDDGKSNVYPFKKRPKHRRRLKHLTAIVKRKRFYTAIPDPLDRAYRDGKVNDTLFRLIFIFLGSDEDFLITREYLESQFSPNTLKKYLPVIEKAKIVEVEKLVLFDDCPPSNIYHTTDPDDWNMSPVLAMPRRGTKGDKSNDIGSTSRMKGSRTSRMKGSEKPNDIGSTSRMKGTQEKPNDIRPPYTSRMKDLSKTFKSLPKKMITLPTLRARVRLRFEKYTASDHIEDLVTDLVEAESNRLLLSGFDKKIVEKLSRYRVLQFIEMIEPSKHRHYDEKTRSEWKWKLENFPAE